VIVFESIKEESVSHIGTCKSSSSFGTFLAYHIGTFFSFEISHNYNVVYLELIATYDTINGFYVIECT
jgi:hypothetical protein